MEGVGGDGDGPRPEPDPEFGVFFSTVQLETECLEGAEAQEIDATQALTASRTPVEETHTASE